MRQPQDPLPRRTTNALWCFLALLGGLGSTACSSSVEPTQQIRYRPPSIQYHGDGTIALALLAAPATIQGLRCRGWVRFHDNGKLQSCELEEETTLQGRTLPQASFVSLDEEGRLQSCFLAQDTRIDGYLCRGGPFKTATAFHPGGGLLSFYPRDAVTIDGVPCAASSQTPVRLHGNGQLAACRLAADLTRDGKTLRKGQVVRFDEAGGLTQ